MISRLPKTTLKQVFGGKSLGLRAPRKTKPSTQPAPTTPSRQGRPTLFFAARAFKEFRQGQAVLGLGLIEVHAAALAYESPQRSRSMSYHVRLAELDHQFA